MMKEPIACNNHECQNLATYFFHSLRNILLQRTDLNICSLVLVALLDELKRISSMFNLNIDSQNFRNIKPMAQNISLLSRNVQMHDNKTADLR